MTTEQTTTPAPAPAPTGAPRRFARLPGAGAPAAAAKAAPAAAAQAEEPAAPADDDGPAESEQANPADMLTKINFDEALAHSSDGKHRGVIYGCKTTEAGNGIWIGIRHQDGASGSALFMMFDKVKDYAGKPTGKFTPNYRGQQEWARFCGALGLVPSELTTSIKEYTAAQTAEKPAILNVELVWDWRTAKNGFLNATLDAEASKALALSGGGEDETAAS